MALQELEGSKSAVRAEICDACKSYLKIVYQEKDPRVDPVAETGFLIVQRHMGQPRLAVAQRPGGVG